jgi:hypothetical protein
VPGVPDLERGLHVRGGDGQAPRPAQADVRPRFYACMLYAILNDGRTHSKRHILEERMRQLETLIEAIPPAVFAAAQTGGFANGPTPAPPPLPAAALHTPVAGPAGHFSSGAPTPALPSLLQQRLARPADGGAADADFAALAPPSMFFVDAQGHTRWHGETSGLPLLDFLVDAHAYRPRFNPHASSRDAVQEVEGGQHPPAGPSSGSSPASSGGQEADGEGAPEVIWMTITRVIPAGLMDECVREEAGRAPER